MHRKIKLQVEINGDNTGASDFESRVQAFAHKLVDGLQHAPLTSGRLVEIAHDGFTGTATVMSVVGDEGLSDA